MTTSPDRGRRLPLGFGFTPVAAALSLAQVQRLYSMFPSGGPGLGLALLRGALAVAVFSAHLKFLSILPDTWRLTGALLIDGALVLGLLTPVFSAGACVIALTVLITHGCDAWADCALLILDAAALLLLGPGAYSLDARLYGRRRLVTPRPRG